MTDTHDSAECDLIGNWLPRPTGPSAPRGEGSVSCRAEDRCRAGLAGRHSQPHRGRWVSTPRVSLAQPPPSRASKNQSKESTLKVQLPSGPRSSPSICKLGGQLQTCGCPADCCAGLLRWSSSHRPCCACGLGPFLPLERALHSQGRSGPARLFSN